MPSLGERVRADFAVEDKLLCDALDGWRGHIQLVEEKNAGAAAGEKFRRIPTGRAGVMVGDRQTAEVGGCELADAEVDEVDLRSFGNCGHGVGFSDARGAPDHNGLEEVFFDKSSQQMLELGWIHFGVIIFTQGLSQEMSQHSELVSSFRLSGKFLGGSDLMFGVFRALP
jgi:hypothetical protein